MFFRFINVFLSKISYSNVIQSNVISASSTLCYLILLAGANKFWNIMNYLLIKKN